VSLFHPWPGQRTRLSEVSSLQTRVLGSFGALYAAVHTVVPAGQSTGTQVGFAESAPVDGVIEIPPAAKGYPAAESPASMFDRS